MIDLIPCAVVTILTLMVFALCYALAIRDARIEALEAHDTKLREMLHDAYAERDEAWRHVHWRDERISALLQENTELLIVAASYRRGTVWQTLDATELIEDLDTWLTTN